MLGLDKNVLESDSATKKKKGFFMKLQLNEEKGLTAALMIHTLNKDPEKVTIGTKFLP
jgi:hypothetical protein